MSYFRTSYTTPVKWPFFGLRLLNMTIMSTKTKTWPFLTKWCSTQGSSTFCTGTITEVDSISGLFLDFGLILIKGISQKCLKWKLFKLNQQHILICMPPQPNCLYCAPIFSCTRTCVFVWLSSVGLLTVLYKDWNKKNEPTATQTSYCCSIRRYCASLLICVSCWFQKTCFCMQNKISA